MSEKLLFSHTTLLLSKIVNTVMRYIITKPAKERCYKINIFPPQHLGLRGKSEYATKLNNMNNEDEMLSKLHQTVP